MKCTMKLNLFMACAALPIRVLASPVYNAALVETLRRVPVEQASLFCASVLAEEGEQKELLRRAAQTTSTYYIYSETTETVTYESTTTVDVYLSTTTVTLNDACTTGPDPTAGTAGPTSLLPRRSTELQHLRGQYPAKQLLAACTHFRLLQQAAPTQAPIMIRPRDSEAVVTTTYTDVNYVDIFTVTTTTSTVPVSTKTVAPSYCTNSSFAARSICAQGNYCLATLNSASYGMGDTLAETGYGTGNAATDFYHQHGNIWNYAFPSYFLIMPNPVTGGQVTLSNSTTAYRLNCIFNGQEGGDVYCYNSEGRQLKWFTVIGDNHLWLGLTVPLGATSYAVSDVPQ